MSLISHLWQSTLCLLLAALLALVFRRASARIRHTIWTFASVKFLVPFSLFVLAGDYLGSLASPLTSPEVTIAIRWLDRPLSLWNLGASIPSSSWRSDARAAGTRVGAGHGRTHGMAMEGVARAVEAGSGSIARGRRLEARAARSGSCEASPAAERVPSRSRSFSAIPRSSPACLALSVQSCCGRLDSPIDSQIPSSNRSSPMKRAMSIDGTT